jgi:nucleotide-binding universal stress UspA family protein
MKILLAVDGSACSDAAVEEVANRPWPINSVVRVLNTYEMPLPPTPEGWALPANYFDEMDQAIRTQSQAIVNQASEKLRTKLDKTIEVVSKSVPGPPRAVILDEADSWAADLIVVGSHGYGRLERLLLGSVSQSVVSYAKCSVEVVRCRESKHEEKK